MDYVLTFVGEALDHPFAEKIRDQLDAASSLNWLAPNACDIELAASVDKARIMSLLGNLKIDFALQPKKMRRKKLLAADMDSTIIKEETLNLLAAHQGCQSEVAQITKNAMQGKIDFAQALHERVALLAGLPEKKLTQILAEDVHIRTGALTLTATMRAHGAQCLLLSGGFEKLVRPIAERTGFIPSECNRFEIKNNILTGNLIPPIRDALSKKNVLLQQAQKMNISLTETIAVGDGANDREMIEAAGLGIAFHAKPVLEKIADVHIRHSGLTALLYMQGYRCEDFVEAA